MPENSSEPAVLYKPIPDFPGYRAGTDGSIWTQWKRTWTKGREGSLFVLSDEWRRLRPSVKKNGYLKLTLFRDGRAFQRLVHRLVLETFVGPCPPGHECAHDNGVRTDCRLDNLFWKTKKGNASDRERHGKTPRGETHGQSKLTTADILDIRSRHSAGGTKRGLAREYGVTGRAIDFIVRRVNWSHV